MMESSTLIGLAARGESQIDRSESKKGLVVDLTAALDAVFLLEAADGAFGERTGDPIEAARVESFVLEQLLHLRNTIGVEPGHGVHVQLADGLRRRLLSGGGQGGDQPKNQGRVRRTHGTLHPRPAGRVTTDASCQSRSR